tara:strand:+ start:135 stop:608 length:474 start_codon:yes stop_codon:yes gene_type:complete
MSGIEDIINNEDWSKEFDDIKGKDTTVESIQNYLDKLFELNNSIFTRDIFKAESEDIIKRAKFEIETFVHYYQFKKLIKFTSLEEAKNRINRDMNLDSDTFDRIMQMGEMIEALIIFPRVSEYVADVLEQAMEMDLDDLEELKNIAKQKWEENNGKN